VYSIAGELESTVKNESSPILRMDCYENTLEMFDIIHWNGSLDDTRMKLARYEKGEVSSTLEFHG